MARGATPRVDGVRGVPASRAVFAVNRMRTVTALLVALAAMVLGAGCGDPDGNGDKCAPDDADGVVGGDVTFDLTVDDAGFSPTILTAQNTAKATLTLHNAGTNPHSFVIDCLATPNDLGCPTSSCFPEGARMAPIAAGESATTTFAVPLVEGIHYFHSDVTGDAPAPCEAGAIGCGQFVVK